MFGFSCNRGEGSQWKTWWTTVKEGSRRRKESLRAWTGRAVLLLQDNRGATTAEYALVLALVVVVLITTLRGLGSALDGKIIEITNSISGASGGGP